MILAASGVEPAVRNTLAFVEECGGPPEASVLGVGTRAPAVRAAFANGAIAHSLDFDDLTPWGNHASSSIIPGAFAVAERIGGVAGQDMIAAIAIGQDLFTRLLAADLVVTLEDHALMGGYGSAVAGAELHV